MCFRNLPALIQYKYTKYSKIPVSTNATRHHLVHHVADNKTYIDVDKGFLSETAMKFQNYILYPYHTSPLLLREGRMLRLQYACSLLLH